MISENSLRQAFRSKLIEISSMHAFAWENVNFEPLEPFIAETIIPSDEQFITNTSVRQRGIIQYDVWWPAGDSVEGAESEAELIKSGFLGCMLANARVYRTQRRAGRQVNGWYIIPIELYYRISKEV